MNNASGFRRYVAATLLLALIGVGACTPPPPDVEPGLNGEVGKALTKIYSKEFRVQEVDYFTVLQAFYRFAQVNQFDSVNCGKCFSEMLDPSGTQFQLSEPCRAMWAVIGAPTKLHMNFTVFWKSRSR